MECAALCGLLRAPSKGCGEDAPESLLLPLALLRGAAAADTPSVACTALKGLADLLLLWSAPCFDSRHCSPRLHETCSQVPRMRWIPNELQVAPSQPCLSSTCVMFLCQSKQKPRGQTARPRVWLWSRCSCLNQGPRLQPLADQTWGGNGMQGPCPAGCAVCGPDGATTLLAGGSSTGGRPAAWHRREPAAPAAHNAAGPDEASVTVCPCRVSILGSPAVVLHFIIAACCACCPAFRSMAC